MRRPDTRIDRLVSAAERVLLALMRTDPDRRLGELGAAGDALAEALRLARGESETLGQVLAEGPRVELEIERSTDPGREIEL